MTCLRIKEVGLRNIIRRHGIKMQFINDNPSSYVSRYLLFSRIPKKTPNLSASNWACKTSASG